jgi:hypothetical protein
VRWIFPVLFLAVACDKGQKAEIDAGAMIADDAAPEATALTETCDPAPAVRFFTSPKTPFTGAPLRVMAVSDKPLSGELALGTTTTSAERRGGPPYFWTIEIPSPAAGKAAVTFHQRACENKDSFDVTVATAAPPAIQPPEQGIWATTGEWSHAYENLYSAWIQILFEAADKDEPSWAALHEVMRDPKRNWLFDHLAAAEDSGPRAPLMKPDCADLPYFLRAYFAFKMGLPFGVAACDRGGGGNPPSCKGMLGNEDDDPRASARKKDGAVAMFGAFLAGTLADRAHSGSARTPFSDENADYYPVPLDWANLRPGTVYADPYGHTLLVAKRIPQDAEHGGVLFAVDGQPDGTVARKRFWRGNFLYATDKALGGPGFKRFRPIVKNIRSGDEAIRTSAEYGDVSREAEKLDVEGFYDKMDDVLSPKPLDPERALMETLAALEEQVRTRVKSVDNGRKWLDKHQPTAPMPDGAEIFETTGVWEDFSTPARDLRLLIAIDVVRGFPARVVRRKERYAIPSVMPDLQKILDRELGARSITYTRTDASPFTLTLAEVLSRSVLLEQAFNPNDCVEVRWGAASGSPEVVTCKAHAPADQRAKMESYRSWFHDRKRPPRK